MKLQRLLPALFIGAIALSTISSITSCKKDNDDPVPPNDTDTIIVPPPVKPRAVLQGDITTDTTIAADSVWSIKGYVYVKNGGVLRIPAGTILKSDVIEKGAIIVERGGKIFAEGTAAKPIVFTSGLPKGQRRPGDWGGIILLGKAPTNRATEPTIEGGVNRQYGGNEAADNSGVLKFVRIEFAGIASAPGSEINGLTLGGVGSGTTIENIIVSYGNDDGYEFFGGTVNCKNLVAFSCLDDDFDFDFGYTGTIQNAISFKNPLFSDAGDASNGIEADNDGSGTTAMPYTHPKLMNFTIVGPNKNPSLTHNYANRWRRAVRFDISKSILIGFPVGGFSMESAGTVDAYKNGISKFMNNIVHSVDTTRIFRVESGLSMTAAEIQTKALADGNIRITNATSAMLTDPFKVTAPNFMPQAGSVAATQGIGAITTTDWTSGWVNWDPNNADY